MSIDEIMRKRGDMQNILKEERSPLAHTIIILSTYPFFNRTIFQDKLSVFQDKIKTLESQNKTLAAQLRRLHQVSRK